MIVFVEGKEWNIHEPSLPTLKKYGLSLTEWKDMLVSSSFRCPICLEVKERYVIDHEHTPRYKKLPPEKRKKFVRGIICSYCNQRVVGRGATVIRLRNGAKYLEEYEKRKHGKA